MQGCPLCSSDESTMHDCHSLLWVMLCEYKCFWLLLYSLGVWTEKRLETASKNALLLESLSVTDSPGEELWTTNKQWDPRGACFITIAWILPMEVWFPPLPFLLHSQMLLEIGEWGAPRNSYGILLNNSLFVRMAFVLSQQYSNIPCSRNNHNFPKTIFSISKRLPFEHWENMQDPFPWTTL